jgi:tetratricopeptide (TPR) repeat protein
MTLITELNNFSISRFSAMNYPLLCTQKIDAAMCHQQAGRLIEAEEIYQSMLQENSENSIVLNLLGALYHKQELYKEAAELFTTSLQIDPCDPFVYNNLGVSLFHLSHLGEAEAAYRQALAIKPDFAGFFLNLGDVLYELFRFNEAVLAYRKAVEIDPCFITAVNKLGELFCELECFEEAAEVYRQAVIAGRLDGVSVATMGGTAQSPYSKFDYAFIYLQLSNILQQMNKYEEAGEAYHAALTLAPNHAEAFVNYAYVLNLLGKYDEAKQACIQALSLSPGLVWAYNNLAHALMSLGEVDAAEKALISALHITPDSALIRHNLSMIYLLKGNYKDGFAYYENRFQRGPEVSFDNSGKILEILNDVACWQGESLSGKTLLVITEQGLGDNLMMLRYLSLLKQWQVKKLVVLTNNSLKRIISLIPCVDDILTLPEQLHSAEFDAFCFMMSLPYLFGTLPNTIPTTTPYIFIPETMKEMWRKRLADIKGIKVGLVWAGSNKTGVDRMRSIALHDLSPILTIKGIQIISLQKGERSNQLQSIEYNIIDWMDECDDLLDTGALIEVLDLVISVDTSVAHLSGALGKPVWLLNRFESEWRWMLDRTDSPWYPSMRIFRQTTRDNWPNVISSLADELSKLIGCRSESGAKATVPNQSDGVVMSIFTNPFHL